MNKLRFKDGKGDPKNFAGFLRDNNLPKGLIPRYRGNRLHILFHICGVYTEHHELFLKFLTTGTVSCSGLQAACRGDFSSDVGQIEMKVLGLFGKLLSGPWMQKFYTSAKDQIDHIDGISVVKNVISEMKDSLADPHSILTRDSL